MEWQYKEGSIYALDENKQTVAEATYFFNKLGDLVVKRVFVAESLRGHGIAGQAMEEVAKYARENGLKVRGNCSYAKHWLEKNVADNADIMPQD